VAPIVYLVGAGPGDPDLITVRGKRCLEQAEVVLYDRLVDPVLLSYAPEGAEMVYVGKRSAQHTVPQDGINALLVEHALAGRRVVRLKGGDPFVFGRGGEEALALRAAGVPFEVVPGISSGVAVPAYAGIPVTHRGLTSHVTFVTGHEDPTKEEAQIDWDKLASDVGTLVIFMGVKNLPKVVDELIRRGRPMDTPIALIRYGTVPQQRTVTGTLKDIVEKVAAAKLRPPAITIVGEVVTLREKLRWFEDRPLFGRRVVVTRPRAQAGPQIQSLRDLGAEVVAFPTIRVEPIAESVEIAAMLEAVEAYDLIVLTSVNGVECFFDRLRDAGKDARCLLRATVVAIGPKTAAACRSRGVAPDVVPKTFVAEGVLEALDDRLRAGGRALAGARILIPRALEAREVLPEAFVAAGATVDVTPLYETVIEDHDSDEVAAVADADYVSFTSASSAHNFAALLRRDGLGGALARVRAVSIGPVTTEAVREEGMQVVVEATEYTVEGLVAALAAHAGAHPA
jgi:uroporphyrinogen III methyltransferase/synthase